MRGWRWICLFLPMVMAGPTLAAPTLFTYRAAESELDTRNHYDIALLRLALEKTRAKYGAYQLEASPPMNTGRALQELKKGTYANFITKQSYNPEFEQQGMLRGSYELDLGVIGYRVCFTRNSLLPELAQLSRLAEWKYYLYGLGAGWQDVNILRHNGFDVMEVALYKSLFPMLAKGRFDLFCRGINEVMSEWPEARQQLEMALEPNMMFYYDLPRFFYANSRDAQGLQRVEEGVRLAAADGSLLRLWKRYYLQSVQYVQPQGRKLFLLHNPMVSQIKWADKQWVYDPISGTFNYRNQ
ncbi:MAG: hypothetical protein ACRCRW_12250 [Aeromonadaceae bacterium]